MCVDSNVASALSPPGRVRASSASGIDGPGPLARTISPFDDVECVRAGLHQFGGGAQGLRAQLCRRKSRGLAAHHGDARGKRAHAAVDAVGLAVDHADFA